MTDIGPEHWKHHFDKRFEAEFGQFTRIIDQEGEGSLYRVLSRFSRWEEGFELIFNTDKNSFDIIEKDWGRQVSLLPTGLPEYIDMWAMGENFKVLPYLKFQIGKFLLDFLIHSELEVGAIVEIGGGWGRNLFDLWTAGVREEITLFSAESSSWGRKITEKLCSLEPNISIAPAKFEIDKPDFDFLSDKNSILYFTHFTMMYIGGLNRTFFEKMLLRKKNITCIHLEPMSFQIPSKQGHVSMVQHVEANLRNFNKNLLSLLVELKNEGLIELTHVYKELIPTRDRAHSTSVIIWKKIT